MRFEDREDAGRQLGRSLARHALDRPIVLGLPRGGVVVADEVARALSAPLDVWVVKKVGAPNYPELGLGAVAEGNVVYLNPEVIADVAATEAEVQTIVRQKQAEVTERVRLLRKGRPAPELAGRTVVLVDDGIATGGTMHAALQALRQVGAGKLVLAVPIAATQSLEMLRPLADEVVCLHATPTLTAIGTWYDDFEQVRDAEVILRLDAARLRQEATPAALAGDDGEHEVRILVREGPLGGTYCAPRSARGLVIFAHGSGSSRFSPRNRQVAQVLCRHGLGTLLFDLLTEEEERLDEQTAELRFDVELLARRLEQVTDWVQQQAPLRALRRGYFGSSTGAAAALIAAARHNDTAAVVSRGGRPDLAWDYLPGVRAPTLLLVGGEDLAVVELNRRAYGRMSCERQLKLVPGATHLFEEPGTLDQVAELAAAWFVQHFGAPPAELPAP